MGISVLPSPWKKNGKGRQSETGGKMCVVPLASPVAGTQDTPLAWEAHPGRTAAQTKRFSCPRLSRGAHGRGTDLPRDRLHRPPAWPPAAGQLKTPTARCQPLRSQFGRAACRPRAQGHRVGPQRGGPCEWAKPVVSWGRSWVLRGRGSSRPLCQGSARGRTADLQPGPRATRGTEGPGPRRPRLHVAVHPKACA